jgi:hypothetical protein
MSALLNESIFNSMPCFHVVMMPHLLPLKHIVPVHYLYDSLDNPRDITQMDGQAWHFKHTSLSVTLTHWLSVHGSSSLYHRLKVRIVIKSAESEISTGMVSEKVCSTPCCFFSERICSSLMVLEHQHPHNNSPTGHTAQKLHCDFSVLHKQTAPH